MKYELELLFEEMESLMLGRRISLLADEENNVYVTLKGIKMKN